MNGKYKNTPVSHWKSPYKVPKLKDSEKEYYAIKTEHSDSEESTTSNASSDTATDPCKNTRSLSIVAEFDDLIRIYKQRPNLTVEKLFYNMFKQTKSMCEQWRIAVDESRRLQMELDKKNHELSDLDNKLTVARKLLDQEKRNTRKAEEERDNLVCNKALKMKNIFTFQQCYIGLIF